MSENADKVSQKAIRQQAHLATKESHLSQKDTFMMRALFVNVNTEFGIVYCCVVYALCAKHITAATCTSLSSGLL